MAVRCAGCGRLSRDEVVCEWCRAEIPPAAGRFTAIEAGGVAAATAPQSSPRALFPNGGHEAAAVAGAARRIAEPETEEPSPPGNGEDAVAVEFADEVDWRRDKATLAILLLILLQLGLTLYLGRLSSWWSLTGILWLVVGYGVKERLSWALVLPLVLFTLDVAMLLFGLGPRERAGFYSPAPMDFLLYLLRLVNWALIWWRLREEME